MPHKPLPFYGSVFVFPSYSSSSPSFLFFFPHRLPPRIECTSNSLGATSLWPAGLPKAIKYCISNFHICYLLPFISFMKSCLPINFMANVPTSAIFDTHPSFTRSCLHHHMFSPVFTLNAQFLIMFPSLSHHVPVTFPSCSHHFP